MGYIVRQTVSSGSAAAIENVSSVITLKKTASSTDPQSAGVAPEAVSSDSSYNRETSVHSATKVCITRDGMGWGGGTWEAEAGGL